MSIDDLILRGRQPDTALSRDTSQPEASPVVVQPVTASIGHNGGPYLEDTFSRLEGSYQLWHSAQKKAWRSVGPEVTQWRLRMAEQIGLTYREYTIEVLERGRHLTLSDYERIADIKSGRHQARP